LKFIPIGKLFPFISFITSECFVNFGGQGEHLFEFGKRVHLKIELNFILWGPPIILMGRLALSERHPAIISLLCSCAWCRYHVGPLARPRAPPCRQRRHPYPLPEPTTEVKFSFASSLQTHSSTRLCPAAPILLCLCRRRAAIDEAPLRKLLEQPPASWPQRPPPRAVVVLR
jgi:hypothetical protein